MKIKRLDIRQQVSINKQPYYVVKINNDNGVITYSFSRSMEGTEELSAVHNEDGTLGEIKKK